MNEATREALDNANVLLLGVETQIKNILEPVSTEAILELEIGIPEMLKEAERQQSTGELYTGFEAIRDNLYIYHYLLTYDWRYPEKDIMKRINNELSWTTRLLAQEYAAVILEKEYKRQDEDMKGEIE